MSSDNAPVPSQEPDARYRTLFDSIDQGFCIVELIFDEQNKPVDYRFLEINPAFERQTGMWNACGKRMRELAPQHEAYWFETYGRIALTGEPARFKNYAEQLSRWFDVYAFRFGKPENRQVAILFSDITEQKKADAKILELNNELQRHISRLDVSNKELDAFSSSVSHDLRAPLRHIIGFAELLRTDENSRLSEEGQRYMDTVIKSANRLRNLVDDLLAFSRMGRTEMMRSPLQLNPIIHEIRESLKAELEGRTVEWVVDALPDVHGDPSMMRQVLTNLISNALKYSRTRSCSRIHIGSQMNAEGERVFFVQDNGVGFDMRHSDKLFGVFQRLHNNDEFEGTGIGLAHVRRIIERHNGRTWAEGKEGQGATFYFTLPG